jgi:hypothetical protein
VPEGVLGDRHAHLQVADTGIRSSRASKTPARL